MSAYRFGYKMANIVFIVRSYVLREVMDSLIHMKPSLSTSEQFTMYVHTIPASGFAGVIQKQMFLIGWD